MSDLHDLEAKSKMVSFRLSADEYRRFQAACSAHGATSVSALARVAMLHLLSNTAQTPVDVQLRQLRDKVRRLSSDIENLASAVEAEPARERIPL